MLNSCIAKDDMAKNEAMNWRILIPNYNSQFRRKSQNFASKTATPASSKKLNQRKHTLAIENGFGAGKYMEGFAPHFSYSLALA